MEIPCRADFIKISDFYSSFLHEYPLRSIKVANSAATLVSYSVPDHRFVTKFTADAPFTG